jgi:hypothetical protein
MPRYFIAIVAASGCPAARFAGAAGVVADCVGASGAVVVGVAVVPGVGAVGAAGAG